MKLHILILTLPTEQATLRMRVWRALKNTGAAMLRDGVYLLPEAQQSHEIFNEMSREISGEGGTAFVFDAERGVSGNPRKFRHSALWNFLGVVRGMTTRQRLPHLSEALWRDAETPGNSATPVPGPQ